MTLTRSQSAEVMAFLHEEFFSTPGPDPSPILLLFQLHEIENLHDFLSLTKNQIMGLTYPATRELSDGNQVQEPRLLSIGHRNAINLFHKWYFAELVSEGQDMTKDDWMEISHDNFNRFRMVASFASSSPNPTLESPSQVLCQAKLRVSSARSRKTLLCFLC